MTLEEVIQFIKDETDSQIIEVIQQNCDKQMTALYNLDKAEHERRGRELEKRFKRFKRQDAAVKAPKKIAYRDPANKDNTWSGNGRRPQWVNDFLANNPDQSLDALKV